jgi:hypothetical protein
MIARASGVGMGVSRFSRLLRGVGVLAMLDAGLDTTRRVESVCKVPPGIGVLQLRVTGVAVGVSIDHPSVADGVEANCGLISATRELISEDLGVEV